MDRDCPFSGNSCFLLLYTVSKGDPCPRHRYALHDFGFSTSDVILMPIKAYARRLMNTQTLVIGESYAGLVPESVPWHSDNLPNLSDYETIILDTFGITDCLLPMAEPLDNGYLIAEPNRLAQRVVSNCLRIQEKLVEVLGFPDSPVNVYALYHPRISIDFTFEAGSATLVDVPGWTRKNNRFTKIHFATDSWCPIRVGVVRDKGKTICIVDQSYKQYFGHFHGWENCFAPDDLDTEVLDGLCNHRWKITVLPEPIATNKTNRPIALELHLFLHRYYSDEEHGRSWEKMPFTNGGTLALLPVAEKNQREGLIQLLLARGKGAIPPPYWVNDIELPGEAQLKTEIASQQEMLEKVKTQLSELESSLVEIQKYKALLYETGLSLEEICKLTLAKLGAKVKPSIVTDEFIIEACGKEALVEVKGNEKSISKRDLSQLITDVGEHMTATEEEIHGILIGNAWRLLPVGERGMNDKPIFPDNVTSIATNHSIGLVSTIELFQAYCKGLEQPQCKPGILDRIINSKGVVNLQT